MSKTGAAAQPESQMIDTPSPPKHVAVNGSGGEVTAALADPEQERDEWDLLDKCAAFAVLLRQKRHDFFSLNKVEKAAFLMNFHSVRQATDLFCPTLLSDGKLGPRAKKIVHDLQKKNWNSASVTVRETALTLVQLDFLLEKNQKMMTRRRVLPNRRSTEAVKEAPAFASSMQKLRKLIDNCKTSISASSRDAQIDATTHKDKPYKPPTKPPATNASGQPWQSVLKFDIDSAMRHHPCPYCGMKTVNAIDTHEEILEKQAEVTQRHENAMVDWVAKGSKGPKPRRGKFPKQRLACFADTLRCNMNQDGGSCYHCKSLGASGLGLPLKNNGHNRVYCACDICQSGCRAVFYQSDGVNIRFFVQQEKDGVPAAGEFGKTNDRNLSATQSFLNITLILLLFRQQRRLLLQSCQ